MLQPSQDKTKILYNAVSKDYDIGTYDDFKTKLQNPEKRKSFYEGVGAEYSLGSYEEFESKIVQKKKDTSTSITPKASTESVQKNGSLGTQDIDPKTGFPKIKPTLSTLPDTQKLAQEKPISVNKEKSKAIQVANQAYDYAIKNYDPKKDEEKLIDEVDNYQFLDGLKQGLKDRYNSLVVKPVNAINEALGGDKNYLQESKPYVPLQAEKKEAIKLAKEEYGKDAKISEEYIDKKAKELFLNKSKSDQMHQLIDEALPIGYDREGIWKELKLNALRSNDKLRSKVASVEVYNSQIQNFDDYAKSIQDKIKNKTVSQEEVNNFNNLRNIAVDASNNLKSIKDNYDSTLKEAKTDEEKLDLFKYNYNDFEKTPKLLLNTTKGIVFGGSKLLAETADFTANSLGINSTKAKALSEISSEVLNETEKDSKQFYRYKASSINNWSDLGSFTSQLASEQLPILASIYMGGQGGLIAVSSSSGGQKINELEEQAKQPFGKIYSQGQKLTAGYLYSIAEYVPELFGTARILKDLERTVASASSASRRLFKDNLYKETFKSLGRTGYNVGLEGGTEYITAESQITIDEDLLDIVKTDYEKNEQRFESFASGGVMGGGMSMVGGAVGFGISQAKLYTERKDVKLVSEILKKIETIKTEIDNNPNLTEEEVKGLYQDMNSLNNKAFDIVDKNAKRGLELSIEDKSNLLDINEQQVRIREDYKKIKESNFSEEIKKEKLEQLNKKFKKSERQRNDILTGTYNEVSYLPMEQQETLKRKAMKELELELNPDGKKDITITNEQVLDRANKIYNESKTNEAEIKSNQSTTETQPQAKVQEQTEAKKVEPKQTKAEIEKERDESIQKNKDRFERSITVDGKEINDFEIQQDEDGKERIMIFHKTEKGASGRGTNLEGNIKNIIEYIKKIEKEKGKQAALDFIKEKQVELQKSFFEYDKEEAERIYQRKLKELESQPQEASIKTTSATKEPKIVVHGSVNGFGLQYSEGVNKEDIVTPQDARGFLPREEQISLNKGNSLVQEDNVLDNGDKKISILTPATDSFGRTSVNTFEFTIPTNNASTTKDIQSILDDVRKGDLKGKELIDETVKQVKKYIDSNAKVKNEAIQVEDTTVNGNVQSSVIGVGESGVEAKPKAEVAPKESIPSTTNVGEVEGDAEVENDVDFALNQIEKGVLQWNGDISSPRVDLGISWADIRKGEADLKRGKVNSVPAKRLVEAIKKAKQEGGYNYKMGTGTESARAKKFVTFEDMEKSTNEEGLTDAEMNDILSNQDQLAEEYDEYFNSLDEETQNEILENYENQPREISEDTKGGESKTNVPTEKETAKPKQEVKPKKPTKQERKDIANAKIDDIVNSINSIDNIFGIKIKVDDVEGLNKQGVDIVKVIASIVKQAVSAGIEIDEAISKTIEHFKKSYDFELSDKDIKDIKTFAEPTKKQPKERVVEKEKTIAEKAKELSISENEYLTLRDKVKNIPQSEEIGNYLSGKTKEDVFEEPLTNDQEYKKSKLSILIDHGQEVLNSFKETFGDDYIEKTLDFLDSSTLNSFEKGIVYAALENDIDTLAKEFPNSKEIKNLQESVYDASQANLRIGSLTINTGRLVRILKAVKDGVDTDTITNQVYSKDQLDAKEELENVIPTASRLNEVQENEERKFTQEEVDAEVEKALEKEKQDRIFANLKRTNLNNRKENLSKNKKDLIEQLRKIARDQLKTMSANPIPVEAVPVIAKLAKVLVAEGAVNLEIVVNEIYETLKDVYKGISKKDIENAIYSNQNTTTVKEEKNKISNIVKQALIDSGFGKTINIKKTVQDENGNEVKTTEQRQVLDWTKLFGRKGTFESLKEKVEKTLKEQGYTEQEISEINNELENEYRRLAKLIFDKAIADLERKNKIKPPVNRKSHNEALTQLYEQGLFDNGEKFTELVHKVIGFTEFQSKTYDKIKKELQNLSNLYNTEIDGTTFSESALVTASNGINARINYLLYLNGLNKYPTHLKLSQIFTTVTLFPLRFMLGKISNLIQNRISGRKQLLLTGIRNSSYMTKELKEQFKNDAKKSKADIVYNGGMFYGDVSSDLLNHSAIFDILGEKINSKIGNALLSAYTLKSFLEAEDSYNKVRLTQSHFVENSVIVLMQKGMSKQEAIKFVSEALTGDNFKKSLDLAKKLVDKANEGQDKKVIKDNKENVHRIAMDIVKQNLSNDQIMSMEEIDKIFNASYKSAGHNLGHEANNYITTSLNNYNSWLSRNIDNAIKEERWGVATSLMVASVFQKTTISPFVGGGANWAVLGLEYGIPFFSNISRLGHPDRLKKIDATTPEGVKNLEKALVARTRVKEGNYRSYVAMATTIVAFALATYKIGGDDEEEKDDTFYDKLEKWLSKPENEWAKPFVDKLSPVSMICILKWQMGSNDLIETLMNKANITPEYYNKVVQLIKTLGDEEEGTTSGATTKLVTSPLNAPAPWKTAQDMINIARGLNGLEPIKTTYKSESAVGGLWEGGGTEFLYLLASDESKRTFDKENESKLKIIKAKEDIKRMKEEMRKKHK